MVCPPPSAPHKKFVFSGKVKLLLVTECSSSCLLGLVRSYFLTNLFFVYTM